MTPTNTSAEMAANLLVSLGAIAIFVGINVLICLIIYRAQKALPPEHRKIEPGLVWLLLIPFFNLVWNFFVFLRVPESFQSYFYSQGRTDVGDAGRSLGLWYSICAACSIVPCIGVLPGLAALVLLILFLIKITGLKNEIGRTSTGGFPIMPPPPAPPRV